MILKTFSAFESLKRPKQQKLRYITYNRVWYNTFNAQKENCVSHEICLKAQNALKMRKVGQV